MCGWVPLWGVSLVTTTALLFPTSVAVTRLSDLLGERRVEPRPDQRAILFREAEQVLRNGYPIIPNLLLEGQETAGAQAFLGALFPARIGAWPRKALILANHSRQATANRAHRSTFVSASMVEKRGNERGMTQALFAGRPLLHFRGRPGGSRCGGTRKRARAVMHHCGAAGRLRLVRDCSLNSLSP